MNKIYNRQRKSDVEELRKPKANVIPSIIRLSESKDYEEARTEWALIGMIDSESPDFIDHCDICNTPLYKTNCILKNDISNKEIKVGSYCIKRFLILSGLSSQEDTIQYVNNLEKEWEDIRQLQVMYSSVIKADKPYARDLNTFHKKLTKILTDRGQYPLKPDTQPRDILPLFQSIFGIYEKISVRERNMLFQILYDPKKIGVKHENKKFRNMTIKEVHQFTSKRSKATGTTLAKSSAYKPDDKYR